MLFGVVLAYCASIRRLSSVWRLWYKQSLQNTFLTPSGSKGTCAGLPHSSHVMSHSGLAS